MEKVRHAESARFSEQTAENDQVFQTLQRMIMLLELPPGAMISQSYLMERLQCGRTPLREALKRLEEDELVVYVPNKGVAIAGLSVEDLRAMAEAVVLVEPECVRIVASEITEPDLGKLEAVVSEAELAGERQDFSALTELDFEFHRIIADAMGNHYLARIMTRLHRHASRFACLSWRYKACYTDTWEEHRQILDALRNRRSDEAGRLVREHTIRAKDRIQGSLRGAERGSSPAAKGAPAALKGGG